MNFLSGMTVAVLVLAVSEIMRIVANTEAYARGIYSLSRKRPAQTGSAPANRSFSPAPPVFNIQEPTPADLQYSPPERHRMQQRVQRAPTRKVTVFRERLPLVERPARPAGELEVVDSMTAAQQAANHELGRLPFDRL